MELRGFLHCAYYNAKLLLNLNTAAAAVLALLVPFIFSFTLLQERELARITELYFSITGIALYSHIASLEWNDNIKEAVYIRKTAYVSIIVLRFVITMLISLLLTGAVLLYAQAQGAEFDMMRMLWGTWISSLFLGSLAFTVINLTGQLPAGYMLSFAYYLFEYMTKGKHTGIFYLFSLTKGEFYCKYNLLMLTAGLLAVSLVYIKRKS
ncbi:MAG: hypothetical protein ACOZCL_18450 [Bacillota bacterium]